MSEDPPVHRITVLTLNQRKPTVDRVITPTIIKHDLNLKKFNVPHSSIQNNAASCGTLDKVTLTLPQFSEFSRNRNPSKMMASGEQTKDSNNPIDKSGVMVGTNGKSQQIKRDSNLVVVKKIGGKGDIKDNARNEGSSDYTCKILHTSDGRKVLIKSYIPNSKSGGKNNLEIRKWQGPRTNNNESDGSNQLPKMVKWKIVPKNNSSSLTTMKHDPVNVSDIKHEQNSQKETPTNSTVQQKQPVVVLEKLKTNCVFSKSEIKDNRVAHSDSIVKEENQENFVETSEEGMFLRDMVMPCSAETSCPINGDEAAKKENCDFNLSMISKELEEEIQSVVQSNIEEIMISSQINNGEGFNYTFPYACGQCDYTAKLQHHLKNHMKIHSADRPFVCDICGKGFKHAHHLAGHKRTHSGERPYSCDECGRDFTQVSNLLRHQKTHQGLTNSDRHKCYKCNRSFSTAYSLKRHSDVHENLKEKVKTIKRYKKKKKKCYYNPTLDDERRQFECAICGRKFLRKEHVTRHMLTHTGESVYSCDVCGKGYSGRQALNKHITIHTGDHVEIDSEKSSSGDESVSDSEEDMEYE